MRIIALLIIYSHIFMQKNYSVDLINKRIIKIY